MSSVNTKAPINNLQFAGTVSGITKEMVGLGNADHTRDLTKPVSKETQTALDLKANLNNPTCTGSLPYMPHPPCKSIELISTRSI